MPTDLSKVKNIGPKTTVWLNEIGIFTLEDVAVLGAVEVYKRLKVSRPKEVSLNALYGLEAALMDIPYTALPDDIKAELKRKALKI